MTQAWMGWKKPLLKPGDTVALLSPLRSLQSPANESQTSRLFIVQRFWTEHEERNRHVLWIPKTTAINPNTDEQDPARLFSSLEDGAQCFSRDIRYIELLSSPSRLRGYERIKPISSHGRLDSGERLLYLSLFFLFWDGFEITRGKSASGEGFYMINLNLPSNARASPNAVRVISLTPPGVKSDVIFKIIQNDIVTGMTTGFTDRDSDGNQIRIFLDLVGFIGDTPAINAALDVLGHTGSACCHLCRFVRRPSYLIGSRYTRYGSQGLSTHAGRSYYQHAALRDSEAKSETCRLLGMSPPEHKKHLPIYALRSAMLQCRHHIPTTRGVPILSGHLDPYVSCLIGPDHLLTGHFRDCINIAYRLLPNREYRQSVEEFLIGFLAECDLPRQNRIFDIEKKVLFSMSMTELYALSVVGQIGFLRGCTAVHQSNPQVTLSQMSRDAISILGSCSALIAHLWNTEIDMRSMSHSQHTWYMHSA